MQIHLNFWKIHDWFWWIAWLILIVQMGYVIQQCTVEATRTANSGHIQLIHCKMLKTGAGFDHMMSDIRRVFSVRLVVNVTRYYQQNSVLLTSNMVEIIAVGITTCDTFLVIRWNRSGIEIWHLMLQLYSEKPTENASDCSHVLHLSCVRNFTRWLQIASFVLVQ